MEIINSKRRLMGMNMESSKELMEQERISNLFSILIIIALSCFIIMMSALIFDLIKQTSNSNRTIVYQKSSMEIEEEDTALRINL